MHTSFMELFIFIPTVNTSLFGAHLFTIYKLYYASLMNYGLVVGFASICIASDMLTQ